MALKTRGNLTERLLSARAGPTPSQRITQTGKVGREFRSELKDLASQGVVKTQDMGMQGLPAKIGERGLRRLRQKRRFGAKTGSVDGVTQ